MDNNKSKDKNSIGYKIGYGLGVIFAVCAAALIVTITIRLIQLMLF